MKEGFSLVRKVPQTADNALMLHAESAVQGSASGAAPALREAGGELSFPWLFATASEPVMIIDAGTDTIVQLNPAAALLLQRPVNALLGKRWTAAIEPASAAALAEALQAALASDRAHTVHLHCRDGAAGLLATISLVRTDEAVYWLVRMARAALEPRRPGHRASSVLDAIEAAGEGFVVADALLRVRYANQTFVAWTGLRSRDQLRGRSLVHWLQLSACERQGLQQQMADRQAVRMLTTVLRGHGEPACEVEVQAVAVPDGPEPCWGFCIRKLEGRARLN
jgi:PAS domain-containing protein